MVLLPKTKLLQRGVMMPMPEETNSEEPNTAGGDNGGLVLPVLMRLLTARLDVVHKVFFSHSPRLGQSH